MKQELFQERVPGNQNNQWYKIDPKRLKKEQLELSKLGFKFSLENNLATWIGNINIPMMDGYVPKFYGSLLVKIICQYNFPTSFPKVIDVGDVLKGKPHVDSDSSLCYVFPPGSMLDFGLKTTLTDLVGILEIFLLKQERFAKTGKWSDGKRHGENAFIEHEFFYGRFSHDELCPCKSLDKNYKNCHLPAVKHTIAIINRKLRWEFGRRRLGRNQICPCSKGTTMGIKYKKCCLNKDIFDKGHEVINLYNELTSERLKIELDLLDAGFEDALKKVI